MLIFVMFRDYITHVILLYRSFNILLSCYLLIIFLLLFYFYDTTISQRNFTVTLCNTISNFDFIVMFMILINNYIIRYSLNPAHTIAIFDNYVVSLGVSRYRDPRLPPVM